MEIVVKAVIGVVCMLKGGNNILLNEYCVTNRAMFTIGKTTLGTGGGNSLVNNLGMLAVRRESLDLLFATVTVSCHFALIRAGNLLYGNPFAKAVCMGVATVNVTRNKANAKRKYKRN